MYTSPILCLNCMVKVALKQIMANIEMITWSLIFISEVDYLYRFVMIDGEIWGTYTKHLVYPRPDPMRDKRVIKSHWTAQASFIYLVDRYVSFQSVNPDSKVHGTNMGPTWVLSVPDGPHVDPLNLAIRGGYMYVDCKWRCVVRDNGT